MSPDVSFIRERSSRYSQGVNKEQELFSSPVPLLVTPATDLRKIPHKQDFCISPQLTVTFPLPQRPYFAFYDSARAGMSPWGQKLSEKRPTCRLAEGAA